MFTKQTLDTQMSEQKLPSTTGKQGYRMPLMSARAGMSVIMFLAVVMMGMRIQDVANGFMHGNAVAGVTPAQAESEKKMDEKPAPAMMDSKEMKKDDHALEKMKDGEAGKMKAGEGGKDAAMDEKPDVINADPVNPAEQENFSEAEVNILKRLSERRQELDKQARDVDQRGALLKITEQRIDKKLGDLKTMQEELRQMITTASAEQKAKTDSMVKIYEIMKPKEAARIFDALDMPVLLDVISHMKEARVAPILAAMDSQKAKLVTSALMEKKPLPPIP